MFDLDILETLVVRSMFPKSLEKAEVAVGFIECPSLPAGGELYVDRS